MLSLLAAALLLVSPQDPLGAPPLRVFLRAGPKTHGEGQHDHPRFLAEWSDLLRERGCRVQGALEFPGAAALEDCDVLVLYAAEGASIHGEERARLEAYLARGGGLVVLHDAICGDDPHWFKTVAGGAWEHGRSTWQEGELGLLFADREHPITKGVANFDLDDEVYQELHLDPRAHVLANAFQTPFDVTPQMWTFEPGAYRAFVAIQGHAWASFSHSAWRTLLLRGIAWAAGRDADLLVRPEERAALRYPPGGPRAPERAAEALVLHPDFELSLVASEPLVVNPISLDWDARGRMWVALTPGYPDKQAFAGVPARDEVVILADEDGDGRMDHRTVFAEGLDLVTSLVFHEDGVIVAQSPEILWLRDRDGDDRADERKVLFSGFGFGDTHAVVSNLRQGLDGWVYATQGYSGNESRHVVGADGVDHGTIGNGLFRFRPDGSAIEMVSAYGSNTWGLDFSRDGELFFTMANGSHLRHVVASESALAVGRLEGVESWHDVTDHDRVVPLRAHERPPYRQIDFVGGFTAASGGCLYTGGAWPAEYDGSHFVCEPTVNLVHEDRLSVQGVTFRASKAREPEFLASTDLWFRPVHLRVGPDGALYLLDFYNQASVHNDTRGPQHGPTNAAVRPDRDHEHGRVWRIQHRVAVPALVPPLAGASEAALVESLGHPNGQVRGTARRLLAEVPSLAPATLELLMQRVVGDHGSRARIEALWLLARRAPAKLAECAPVALRDADPAVRKNALRAVATLDDWGLARVLVRPEAWLDEPDARTRLAGLELLARCLPDAGFEALARRALSLSDDWSLSAVVAIAHHRPARFVAAALRVPPSPVLARLLRALAAEIAREGDLGQAVEIVTTLGEQGPEARAVVPPLLAEFARGFGREHRPWASPRLDAALVRLLRSADVDVALAALPLGARWSASRKVQEASTVLGERLASVVGDAETPFERRLAALEAMLAMPERETLAIELAGAHLLDPSLSPDEQGRTIERLAPHVLAAPTLCARLEQLSRPAREQVLAALLARPAATASLLDALESGTLRAPELGPQALHRLRTHPDAATAARANAVLAKLVDGERDDKDALIAELALLVDRPGNAAHGRELFAQNCGNCHTARGVETRGGVGPDLSGMGTHGARELLPFLLDPNRSVEPAYLEYVAETLDGELVDGVIARETSEALLLRNAGGERELRRSELAGLRSTGRSPMPTGFESLGAEALRDLVAFLAGDWAGFRVLDLRPWCTSSTSRGLYDVRRDANPMRFRQYGVLDVEGVPFEVLDPARQTEERNALTLGGGLVPDWDSRSYPRRVELPLGFALSRLHVLGGIAAWGYPYTGERTPAVELTWHYAGGEQEVRVLRDGTEFADWIARNDVPGSKWVDLLEPDSRGQVRTFFVEPAHPERVIESITLASLDNHLAPTFLALTAQLTGANPIVLAAPALERPEVLVFGGGSSHDFARWFGEEDTRTLAALGKSVAYTESPEVLAGALPTLEVLVLCNNQPLADPGLRRALLGHVERGGGLVLVHAATWYNWPDWPEFNAELVGGGARGHEAYGEFAVALSAAHPVTEGVPRSFSVRDELYRLELSADAGCEVLARGRSLTTGAEFPLLWTLARGKGRIVGLTLGHDGASHELAAYRALLTGAVRWAAGG